MDKEKIVQDAYNKIGKRYQESGGNRDISELKEIINLLPPKARILDAGCGTGIPDTKYLHDSGFDVIGVDFSDGMLKIARENLPNVTFIKQNITELDFPDNSFDGLISFSVIIHIPREKHKPMFQQFHKLLKPDGIILVSMAWSEWEEIGEFCGEKMFWSHFKPETSLQIIKDSGFSIIKDWFVTTPDYYNRDSESEKHYYILAKNSK